MSCSGLAGQGILPVSGRLDPSWLHVSCITLWQSRDSFDCRRECLQRFEVQYDPRCGEEGEEDLLDWFTELNVPPSPGSAEEHATQRQAKLSL